MKKMTIASITITMTDKMREKYQKEFDEIDNKCSALQKLDKGITTSMSFNVPVSTTDELQIKCEVFKEVFLAAHKITGLIISGADKNNVVSKEYLHAAVLGNMVLDELKKRKLINIL